MSVYTKDDLDDLCEYATADFRYGNPQKGLKPCGRCRRCVGIEEAETIDRAIDVLDDVLSWGPTPEHILRPAKEVRTELKKLRGEK